MTETVVTLLTIIEREDAGPRGEVTTVSGGDAHYFELPNASFAETIKALEDAGFKRRGAPRPTRLR